MKVSLNWCPLCEKTRLQHIEPTLWKCDNCNILFELTTFFYGIENDGMVMRLEFTITDKGEKEVNDGRVDARKPM